MKCMVISVLHPRKRGYDCRVPDFPGCVTGGETLDEAIAMVEDAANFWACGIETDGRPLPVLHGCHDVEHGPEDILHVVPVDTERYRAANG